jgi:hypothetical protein
MISAKKEAGEVLVAVDKNGNGDKGLDTKEEIIAARYGDLQGQPITLSKAAKKYGVPRGTLEAWQYKGYFSASSPDAYPKLFDEAEIAYCAGIYRKRKKAGTGFRGAPLLDSNGLPYKLKRPDVAKYRRSKTAS